jgi:hypothetical protein
MRKNIYLSIKNAIKEIQDSDFTETIFDQIREHYNNIYYRPDPQKSVWGCRQNLAFTLTLPAKC